MKPWLRRTIKSLGIILLILIAIPLLVFLALQHQGVRGMVVDRVLTEVNESIPGTIEIDRVEGPLTGALTAHGIRVVDGRGRLAAEVDQASVRFRLAPLIGGRVIVDSLQAQGATVVVRNYKDGVLNWQTLTDPDPEPSEPSDIPIFLDSVHLIDGAVAYLDETTEFQEVEASEALRVWRRERIDDLDDAVSGEFIRERFNEAWHPHDIAPFAEPRAPIALWITDLEFLGAAQILGFDIEAQIPELTGLSRTDLIAEPLPSAITEIDVAMGETTLLVEINSVTLGDWLESDSIEIAMILPPRVEPASDNSGSDNPADGDDDTETNTEDDGIGGAVSPIATPDDPFENLVVNLSEVRVFQDLLGWAAPDIELASPLYLRGDVAMDPVTLHLAADLSQDGAAEPILVGLRIDHYDQDFPEYSAGLRADQFQPDQWVLDPEFVAVETNLRIQAEGRGFEPEDLQARVQARLDDTLVDDTYEARLIHADVSIEDGIITGRRVTALTPYLDLFASFHFDPQGHAKLKARTTADADQTAEVSRWAEARPTRANLAIDAEANFDPDVEDPLDSLESLTASATWDFTGFRAEDIALAQSSGEVESKVNRVTTATGDRYQGTYQITASGRGLELPDLEVSTFSLSDRGRATLTLPMDDPIDALQTFRNNARLRASGIRTPDLRIARANLAVDGQKTDPARRRIGGQLTGDIEGLVVDDLTIARIDADVFTTVDLARGEDPFELIERFELTGNASAEELLAPDIFVEQSQLQADLRGTLDTPTGGIELSLSTIEAAGETFDRAVAVVELEDLRQGSFDVQAWRPQGERYFVGSSFSFDPRYSAFTLTDLGLGTDRIEWRARPDSLLRWTGRRLEFEQLHLESADQAIAVNGFFEPDSHQDLELRVDNLRFEDQRRGFYLEELLPEVSGELDVTADVAGTAQRPTLDLVADLQELVFDGNGPFSAELSAQYADELLRVRHFSLDAFDQRIADATAAIAVAVDLDGRAELLWDEDMEVNLNLAQLDLSDFHQPLPILDDYGVTGSIRGLMNVSGRPQDPFIDVEFDVDDFTFQGEVDGDFLDLRDVDFFTRLRYESRATGGEGLSAAARVTWQDEETGDLLIETPLPIEEWAQALVAGEEDPIVWRDEFLALPFRLRLKIPSLDLARIPLESLREQNLAGQADVDIDITGTVQNPEGKIDLDLADIGFDRFRDLSFQLNTRLRDQQANFERISFTWGNDEIFVADGTVPLPIATLLTGEIIDDIPIDFRWQLRELPISRLSPIDYDFARIQGSMAAFVELTGTLRSPEFRSRAGLFNTRLGDGNPGTLYLEISGADNEINVHGAACHRIDPFLSFDGSAPILMDIVELARGGDWQLPGEIDLRVHSDEIELSDVVPTQLISDYILDPRGRLAVDVDVGGTWEEPNMEGFFEITDGAITLPEFARRFTNINGRIDLDEEEISIARFSLDDGPSEVELSGVIGHHLFIPDEVDLRLVADQFNIGGFGVDFPVFLTADTTVVGNISGEPGEINVHIRDLEVVLTDDWDRALHSTELDDDIVVLDGRRDERPAADIVDPDTEGLGDLNLVVNVVIDRNAWARHPNGDINLQANVSAEIVGNLVTVTGTVDALRGELEFLGRRFVVQESEINFVGSIPPNPRLQIEAHHPLDRAITQALGPATSGEPRIIFRITGTAEAPRLELQSDPAMTDTEILFVLMTGRPPDRTGIGQEEGVATQALAAVGGLFFGMLQEELAGTVPVDVLRLEPAVPGMEGGRLEVGKFLTNDLFISYRRQFGADEDVASNIIRLEYHFLPRWMAEVRYTDRNEGGFNLFWDAL